MNNIYIANDSDSYTIISFFNKKELKYLKSKLLQQHDFQTKDYFFKAIQIPLGFFGFSVWAKIKIDNYLILSDLAISHISIDQITEIIKQIDTIISPVRLREIEI